VHLTLFVHPILSSRIHVHILMCHVPPLTCMAGRSYCGTPCGCWCWLPVLNLSVSRCVILTCCYYCRCFRPTERNSMELVVDILFVVGMYNLLLDKKVKQYIILFMELFINNLSVFWLLCKCITFHKCLNVFLCLRL
jgi:hypothetical protein